MSAIASSTLYNAIIELEKELHSDPDLFNEMSIYEQFTFLASFFAVHTNEKVRGSDEDWLGIVDKFLEVIDSQRGGGGKYDTELSTGDWNFQLSLKPDKLSIRIRPEAATSNFNLDRSNGFCSSKAGAPASI